MADLGLDFLVQPISLSLSQISNTLSYVGEDYVFTYVITFSRSLRIYYASWQVAYRTARHAEMDQASSC